MITDEMLAEAAAELNAAMIAALPDPIPHHTFSPAFERKMKRIIRRANYPVLYRIGQRIAAIVIITVISLMILATSSPKVRAKVITWIKNQYASFVEYTTPERNTRNETEVEYYLSETPDGYRIVREENTVGLHAITFENENNNQIHFIYSTEENFRNIFVKKDKMHYTETVVNSDPAEYYKATDPNETNILIWTNDESGYVFYLSSNLDM